MKVNPARHVAEGSARRHLKLSALMREVFCVPSTPSEPAPQGPSQPTSPTATPTPKPETPSK